MQIECSQMFYILATFAASSQLVMHLTGFRFSYRPFSRQAEEPAKRPVWVTVLILLAFSRIGRCFPASKGQFRSHRAPETAWRQDLIFVKMTVFIPVTRLLEVTD